MRNIFDIIGNIIRSKILIYSLQIIKNLALYIRFRKSRNFNNFFYMNIHFQVIISL